MDQTQLLDLGKQLVLLLSPLIAQGAIQKIGENTTDATAGLFKRAWSMLQSRFKSSEAQSALMVYQSLPQSRDVQALVAQDPTRMGYLGVKTCVAHIKGEKVEPIVDTGVRLVTLESLNDPEIRKFLNLE